MEIFIDGDGCPVIKETIQIAKSRNISVSIICDNSHVFDEHYAKVITVAKGSDSVDFALVNMLRPRDIVITQDYGLAAMSLAKKAIPIHQSGMIYTNENIESLLFKRFLAKEIRNSGGRIKKQSKRTKLDNQQYIKSLLRIIEG